MENIVIDGEDFTCIQDFQDIDKFRYSFNDLAKQTFGFDLEQYYQRGFWSNDYIPYAITDTKNILSNVSVLVLDFILSGNNVKCIQLATVMTQIGYRNKGLSRLLIQKIIAEWSNHCDLIYLFANDSVLDFYSALGFKQAIEYQYEKKAQVGKGHPDIKKLDTDNPDDLGILIEKLIHFKAHSRFSCRNPIVAALFQCLSLYKEKIYYIQEYDTVAIAEIVSDTLYLHDYFSSRKIETDSVINCLCNSSICRVVFGFTPEECSGYTRSVVKVPDSTLFVLSDMDSHFQNTAGIRFPILTRL